MTKFLSIYYKIMGHEGYYSNNDLDRGGETYRGVSRIYHPNWNGWDIIDEYKENYPESFVEHIKDNRLLEYWIKQFYKKNYYDVYDGDEMPDKLALELFDQAINLGVKRTIKHLQRALNVLNRDELLYKDLTVDGIYGNITKKAWNKYIEIDGDMFILITMLNVLQGNHYIELMEYDSSQESFARGWFKRVIIEKD